MQLLFLFVGGLFRGIGWFIGTFAALLQVLWGLTCIVGGFLLTAMFGALGFIGSLFVWFAVYGLLGVVKSASKPH